MIRTLAWIKGLRWPPDISLEGPLQIYPDVNWIEFATCWYHFNQKYFPVIRKDVAAVRRLVHPKDYRKVCGLGTGLSEMEIILSKI